MIRFFSNVRRHAPFAKQEALRHLTLLILVMTLALLATGCSSWERQTYQSLAASKAVIDRVAADYATGAIPQTVENRQAIERARLVQTAAVEAFRAYAEAKVAGQGSAGLDKLRLETISALQQIPAVLAPLQAINKS